MLGKSLINIITDRRGSLIIVKAIEDLKAATLLVLITDNSELLVINPINGFMEKIMSLDTNNIF